MGIINFLQKLAPIKGDIAHYGLSEWWLTKFSKEEKDYIVKSYNPLGLGKSSLIKGEKYESDLSVARFLSALASWFNNKADGTIACKIIKKAESMINESTNILDKHFLFGDKISIYYKQRDKAPQALNAAIKACKQQINITPETAKAFKYDSENQTLPTHKGYEQLTIIEEKALNLESAIEIAEQAMSEGWNGNWEKRIKRCKKKLYHY